MYNDKRCRMRYSIEELMDQNLHNKIVTYIGYFTLFAYDTNIEPGEIFVNAQFTLDDSEETYTIKRDKYCNMVGVRIPKNEKLFTIEEITEQEASKKDFCSSNTTYSITELLQMKLTNKNVNVNVKYIGTKFLNAYEDYYDEDGCCDRRCISPNETFKNIKIIVDNNRTYSMFRDNIIGYLSAEIPPNEKLFIII